MILIACVPSNLMITLNFLVISTWSRTLVNLSLNRLLHLILYFFHFFQLLVSGLAKLEGELIDCDSEEVAKDTCTKYQLTGIVVHSGQASGGHYYSFIVQRLADGSCKWYKFDDNDVSEWKMDDEEEMKAQCFGGDYLGEMYDSVLKRPSCRRQKRWWNAYMLFYTRLDAINPSKDPM